MHDSKGAVALVRECSTTSQSGKAVSWHLLRGGLAGVASFPGLNQFLVVHTVFMVGKVLDLLLDFFAQGALEAGL